ncbi:hypothetical protein L1987_10832 [Smallanthus sonchifolius]|uniref:Uncharacterized protein n=1 Tax=Smallanthus sonchifolius TaxID=185202 RepID=A0ACB9JBB7_9ASTR|nr:hypothetical protein L1987_10832 [Smallanthus sonchifolius]
MPDCLDKSVEEDQFQESEGVSGADLTGSVKEVDYLDIGGNGKDALEEGEIRGDDCIQSREQHSVDDVTLHGDALNVNKEKRKPKIIKNSMVDPVAQAQTIKNLIQDHNRPRKRPRLDDPFDLDGILGLNQTQVNNVASESTILEVSMEVPEENRIDLNVYPQRQTSEEDDTMKVGDSIRVADSEGRPINEENHELQIDKEVRETISLGNSIGVNLQQYSSNVRGMIMDEGFNGFNQ